MIVADERTPLVLALSPGQAGDAPWGRALLRRLGPQAGGPALLMDRAYEGDATRALAEALGYRPVVPPLRTRIHPWAYDRVLYRQRNEVERFFCASSASAASPPATTSWIASSLPSSTSPSSTTRSS